MRTLLVICTIFIAEAINKDFVSQETNFMSKILALAIILDIINFYFKCKISKRK